MPSSPSPVCHTTPAAAPPVPAAEPDWAAVLAALPLDAAELERTARQHGALVRRRAVRSAPDLLRLALAYALTGWSLRLTAVWAELGGLAVLSEAARPAVVDRAHRRDTDRGARRDAAPRRAGPAG